MRTTITLNDALFRAVKIRAAESGENISDIVEEALTYQVLEDTEDVEDALGRESEPAYSFADLVTKFKAEGLL